jgi:hypothetical protein
MKNLTLPLACLLAACASTPPPKVAADVTPLVLAEHAFAAETAVRGWNAGVRAFAAADAVVLDPLPVNALASLDPARDAPAASPLQWRPAFAGIAQSRDLGFTTGPYFLQGKGYVGHYFTVWHRDAGGAWEWILDGGVNVLDAQPQPADAPIESLPPAQGKGNAGAGSGSGESLAIVRNLESRLAQAAGTEGERALAPLLAGEVHLNRASLPRAIGRQAALATLKRSTQAIQYELVEAIASAAGDLVLTYGRATWNDGQPRIGSYARIWQCSLGEWRIVYDQIVPPR